MGIGLNQEMLMYSYSTEELIFLGTTVDQDVGTVKDKDYEKLIESLIPKFPNQTELIYEFIGCYCCMLPWDKCEEFGLDKVAFEYHFLDVLPLISSDKPWEKLIAKWRAVIEK